ncbi:MAG: hypothetical protein AOY29_12425 [Alcanivorax borkumensis]|jgi:hypothetical protein|nr:hypothetical protein Y017_00910 [Alcanivorax sp. 97CO-5]OJH07891.1 MAG: hypothetical protein AOY29_12425 [Alcanivorax borkumensis]PKG02789.1 hypothetical protein Y019_00920 [Alcanivorax sp. 97CO-6]
MRACRAAFYGHPVIFLHHINKGFEELGFLLSEPQLFFKLLDTLFWGQRFRHGKIPTETLWGTRMLVLMTIST